MAVAGEPGGRAPPDPGVAQVYGQVVEIICNGQGGRAQLVGGVLRGSLRDAVTCLDVVQQEVAVRMNDLVSERLRHDERPAIDERARWHRREGRHVAGAAADLLEQRLARVAGRARSTVGGPASSTTGPARR